MNKETEVKSINIKLKTSESPVLKNIEKVLKEEIQKRCNIDFSSPKYDFEIEIGITPSGNDGFKIEKNGKGVKIYGNSESGLLSGIGYFLRNSEFTNGKFIPSEWEGESFPEKEVRGIYFATHFYNFYHYAPIGKIKKYIEELSLWGFNAINVWFDMHHFNGIDAPRARKMIERLREILKAVKNIGLKTGLGVLANEGYNNSPVELRADQRFPGTRHIRGGYGVELCPSKPGAKELILKWFEEEFNEFSDIGMDYLWIWPYDQGGCCCEKCSPWGANGFLIMAENIAKLSKKYFPDIKIILSTWLFDCVKDEGEWKGLYEKLKNRPDWVNYILADSHTDFPQFPLKYGIPGDLPMLNFPEISMWGMHPWGGFGANPLPERFQKLWNQVKKVISGGFPYSEGIFEDINKVIISQFYWNDKNSMESVKEYIKFYFSPEVVDEVSEVTKILEKNHNFFHYHTPPSDIPDEMIKDGEKAYFLMKKADMKLPEWAKNSWRWRILFLRAYIDYERLKNNGEITKRCDNALKELTKIYFAERAIDSVAPPVRKRRK